MVDFWSLVAMIAGSKLLLQGSVAIAKNAGISDEVIGLTLIAAGTSLGTGNFCGCGSARPV